MGRDVSGSISGGSGSSNVPGYLVLPEAFRRKKIADMTLC
jgi:hypothetical protein